MGFLPLFWDKSNQLWELPILISFEYIELGLGFRKSLSPPLYVTPSHWRLIILQQGVWEVDPVSELSVEAILIKLRRVGKVSTHCHDDTGSTLRDKRENTWAGAVKHPWRLNFTA